MDQCSPPSSSHIDPGLWIAASRCSFAASATEAAVTAKTSGSATVQPLSSRLKSVCVRLCECDRRRPLGQAIKSPPQPNPITITHPNTPNTHRRGRGQVQREGDPEPVPVPAPEKKEGEHHEPYVEQREGEGEEPEDQHHGRALAGGGIEHARVARPRGEHAAEDHGGVHEPEADAGGWVRFEGWGVRGWLVVMQMRWGF